MLTASPDECIFDFREVVEVVQTWYLLAFLLAREASFIDQT